MFPIDESFKTANCCRISQWEDILCLNGHRAQVGVFLENDDLKDGRGHMKDRGETHTAAALFGK